MPPSISDTFVMLKPERDWPDRGATKAQVVEKVEEAAATQIGAGYEITQPIQMRFNELMSGVRSDVAVKVYGDDFAAMVRTANQIAAVLGGIRGAADVRVEQVSGLPMITAEVDRAAAARWPVVRPVGCSRATAASTWWSACRTKRATTWRRWP